MNMQARYTGPFKAARPPLSTTPYREENLRLFFCRDQMGSEMLAWQNLVLNLTVETTS